MTFLKTVLVADDHRDLLELVQFILEAHGYRVVTAKDGIEAVELVERSSPDAVVMDLWMPGLDGVSATKQIRASHQTLPIIAHTAHPATLGGDAHLFNGVCLKPCAPSHLVAMLRDVIGA